MEVHDNQQLQETLKTWKLKGDIWKRITRSMHDLIPRGKKKPTPMSEFQITVPYNVSHETTPWKKLCNNYKL
jgi:hypothetical protein